MLKNHENDKIRLLSISGCRIPVVRLLWEQVDWVQFPAARPMKTFMWYFYVLKSLRYLKKNKRFIYFILASLAIGGFFGSLVTKIELKKNLVPINDIQGIHDANVNYKFINPLLAVDIPDQKDFTEFTPFQAKVQALVQQLQNSGKTDAVGFYFRDFNTGHWVGIGENNSFFPASLLKVPLLIAYYKEAESDTKIFSQKLTYDGKTDSNAVQFVKPSQVLQAGQGYTIEDLIHRMIVYSDNNAANLLVLNIDQNSFQEVYSDLGISLPDTSGNFSDFMSAKQYSLFFRVLRNATYLNREYSEKALGLLSQVEYKNGLAAGVPPNIVIAHKFGEYVGQNNGQIEHELHDCGIIYKPSHPYFLCVMTKGKNEPDLEDDIKKISNLVYNEVTSNYKN